MHENVKILRELKNFTQKFMANQLFMSQSNYSRIEKGLVRLNTETLKQISKILNVTESEIINLDENVIYSILKKKKPNK
jgi:transcriptional regulator with XRE-family HTH domain